MNKLNIQFFAEEKDLGGIFSQVNDILKNIDLKDVDSESSDSFSDLPDGYYLCEVEKAELTESKSSGNPMVAWQFKTVEDGINFDEDGNVSENAKTSNRKIFLHHVLKDANSVERFVSDALKFEGEEPGQPLLEKEYFVSAELMEEALEVLVGYQIYIHVDTNKDNQTWKRLVSWKRAEKLGLI